MPGTMPYLLEGHFSASFLWAQMSEALASGSGLILLGRDLVSELRVPSGTLLKSKVVLVSEV
jgi:hypothetical protein